MLSILLILRLDIYDVNYSLKRCQNNQPHLFIHETSFDELLHDNFTPIRNYAKNDAYVMVNVLEAFKNILFRASDNEKATDSLFVYLNAIIEDIDTHISNEYDREQITNMLKAIARISEQQGEKLLARFASNQ